MARYDDNPNFWRVFRQFLIGALVVTGLLLFLLWRIDNPRVNRLRMAVADVVMPGVEWTAKPLAGLYSIVEGFQSYERLHQQNQELRRELQEMKGWREAFLELEQENARLLALNKVRINARMTYVTGDVMTDSAGPFSRSALLNIGENNGVTDGAAAVDGLGLVGRISGVGAGTARLIYLTDINSRVPVIVEPSHQHGLSSGDNSAYPRLEFLESPDRVKPGDRVITSGDGRVLPPDLLLGYVIQTTDGQLRIRPAADYERLEFVRVLNYNPPDAVRGEGGLIERAAPLPSALSGASE